MTLLLNLLWFVIGGGVFAGLAWMLLGTLLALSVVGLPFAFAAFRIAGFAAWPFGRTLVDMRDLGESPIVGTELANVLWVIFAGIWLWIGQLTGTHWDRSLGVTWKGVITHVLMIQNMWDPAMFNHALWSVATEWQLYFVFPLLVWMWRRCGWAWTLASALVLGNFVCLYGSNRILHAQPQYLGLFALGMTGAHLIFSRDAQSVAVFRRVPWTALFAVMTSLLALLFLIGDFSVISRYEKQLDTYVGILALVTMLAAAGPGIIRRVLEGRFLVWVGTFSYSIYLIHAPLLQLIWQYLIHPLGFGSFMTLSLLVIVGTPLIVASSYVFFLCCEKPFLNTAVKRSEPHDAGGLV